MYSTIYKQYNNKSLLNNLKVSDFFWTLLFILLLVENPLQTKIWSPFAYIDEIVALILLFKSITISFHHNTPKYSKLDKISFVLLILLIIIGFIGNLSYNIQKNNQAILIDFFTCLKFFIAFYSFKRIIEYTSSWNSLFLLLVTTAKIFIFISVVCLLLDQTIHIGMSTERRFGIRAFVFLFAHPSNYAAAIVGLLGLFLVNANKNKLSIICCFVLLLFTTRFKAISFGGILLVALVFFNKTKKISLSIIIFSLLIAVALSLDQIITYYFSNTETARAALLFKSFDVANWFFPFGSGFGTYGGEVTKTAYTNLYYLLGLSTIYGLTPLEPIYLADMFWPTIIAQFGWIGLILFISLLIIFLKMVASLARKNNCFFWSALSIPVYLLVTSTSEPSFYSSYSVYLAFLLIIILYSDNGNNSHKPIIGDI